MDEKPITLTFKQQAFVSAFLVNGGNATAAAIQAGYSAKTANEQGAQILRITKVQAAIQTFRKEMQKKTEVTVERLVQELAKIAFSDIGDIIDAEGDDVQVKKLSDLSSDIRASISEISSIDTKYGTKKAIKLHSKLAAIDQLMKHLGGYVTLNDIIDRLTPEQVEEISEKLLTKLNQNEKKG